MSSISRPRENTRQSEYSRQLLNLFAGSHPFTYVQAKDFMTRMGQEHKEHHEQLQQYLAYAQQKHRDQMKKPREEPYINHVLRVTLLLREHDLELVIAALLHDVVEKTDTSLEEIKQLAGPSVALLVKGVTKRPGNRDTLQLLRQTLDQDKRVITLRLADRLDNIRYSYPLMDDARKTRYRAETLELIGLAKEHGISDFTGEIRAELET